MFSTEFLITSLIVVLIPGTGVIFTVSTALLQGRTAGVLAALGGTIGIVPHLLATIFGLAAVMHTSALAFEVLRYAGVAYLFYVAWATWRDKAAFAVDSSAAQRSGRQIVIKGFLLNILNPKLTIFFLAFLPQFVDPGRRFAAGRAGGAVGGVHGDDLRRVRGLRRAGARFSPHGDRIGDGAGLAAPRLRGGVRGTGRPACAAGSLSALRVSGHRSPRAVAGPAPRSVARSSAAPDPSAGVR